MHYLQLKREKSRIRIMHYTLFITFATILQEKGFKRQ